MNFATPRRLGVLVGAPDQERVTSLHDIPAEPDVRETVEKVLVTPQLAKEWLDSFGRKANRKGKINRGRVALYAEMMAAGRWECSGEHAITFALDGLIGNAHHRLWAVIAYGRPVWFMVRRGVRSIRYIDTNTQIRTHKQIGYMFGFDTGWDPALKSLDFAQRALAGNSSAHPISDIRLEALRAEFKSECELATPARSIRIAGRTLPSGCLAATILACQEPAGPLFIGDLSSTAGRNGGSQASKNLVNWLETRNKKTKQGSTSLVMGALVATLGAYEQFRLGETKEYVRSASAGDSTVLQRLFNARAGGLSR